MPRKYQYVLAFIGSFIALDVATRPLRTKCDELARIAIDLDKQNDILREQLNYLITVINENDIELDEFDLIVLNNVIRT